MNIDLQNLYSTYNNIELLKITNQPDQYQPEAVQIAHNILEKREVTPEDAEVANQWLEQKATRKQKQAYYKQQALDAIKPIIIPGSQQLETNWYRVLMLAVSIQFGWIIISHLTSLYHTINNIIHCFNYNSNNYCIPYYTDINTIFRILALIYLPIIIWLLYKKRKTGWIALYAERLFTLLMLISQLYIFFKYKSIHNSNYTSLLWTIVLSTAFVTYTGQQQVMAVFGVTKQIKYQTIKYTVAGSIIISGIFMLIAFI